MLLGVLIKRAPKVNFTDSGHVKRDLFVTAAVGLPMWLVFYGLQMAGDEAVALAGLGARGRYWRTVIEREPRARAAAFVDPSATARAAFDQAMADDLNTAAALGEVFELVRALNTAADGTGTQWFRRK